MHTGPVGGLGALLADVSDLVAVAALDDALVGAVPGYMAVLEALVALAAATSTPRRTSTSLGRIGALRLAVAMLAAIVAACFIATAATAVGTNGDQSKTMIGEALECSPLARKVTLLTTGVATSRSTTLLVRTA